MLLMPPPWPPGPLQSNVREASKVHASKSLDAIEAPSDRLRFCSFCRCWLRAERHYHRRGAWDMRRLRARAVAVQLPCRCQQCAEDMHRAVLRCVTRCRIATLLAARGCAVQRSAQRSARGVRATWTARQLVSQRVSLGSKWSLHESRGCETVRPAGLGANLARARQARARGQSCRGPGPTSNIHPRHQRGRHRLVGTWRGRCLRAQHPLRWSCTSSQGRAACAWKGRNRCSRSQARRFCPSILACRRRTPRPSSTRSCPRTRTGWRRRRRWWLKLPSPITPTKGAPSDPPHDYY
jgi:hypothetical protein